MHGLTLAQVDLDRKALSNLAIQDPDAFAELVRVALEAVQGRQKAANTT
jgi:ribosomal protein L20